MSKKTPYTKVEVVEERHPNQPESVPLVRTNKVLINGKEVRVAKDGIWIDYDHNLETSNELPGGVVAVTVELLVDEFSIRQVPNGYTDGKTSTSTGDHLHFSGHVSGMSEEEFAERMAKRKKRSERFPFTGVDMEDGKGTPVTTKIEQPRDHLGRFTRRK